MAIAKKKAVRKQASPKHVLSSSQAAIYTAVAQGRATPPIFTTTRMPHGKDAQHWRPGGLSPSAAYKKGLIGSWQYQQYLAATANVRKPRAPRKKSSKSAIKAGAARVTTLPNSQWSWLEVGAKKTSKNRVCGICLIQIEALDVVLTRKHNYEYYYLHKQCMQWALTKAPPTLDEAEDDFTKLKNAILKQGHL